MNRCALIVKKQLHNPIILLYKCERSCMHVSCMICTDKSAHDLQTGSGSDLLKDMYMI